MQSEERRRKKMADVVHDVGLSRLLGKYNQCLIRGKRSGRAGEDGKGYLAEPVTGSPGDQDERAGNKKSGTGCVTVCRLPLHPVRLGPGTYYGKEIMSSARDSAGVRIHLGIKGVLDEGSRDSSEQ